MSTVGRWAGPRTGMGHLEAAYDEFLAAHAEYRDTAHIDRLRHEEYARLDERGQVYLDYGSAALCADRQVRAHAAVVRRARRRSPAATVNADALERVRARVLTHFRAAGEEYDVLFTPDATSAIRRVGEAYPFERGDRLALLCDNHHAVHGIQEFARQRGVEATYVPCPAPALRADVTALARTLDALGPGRRGLFAFPAQSNFSGVQHALTWVGIAQSRGWHVLLDAAAFVPTNRLDLSVHQPDFLAFSFYKMFGYPTGIGCLLARRDALAELARPLFCSASGDDPAIPAVEIGLDWLDHVGLDAIRVRTSALGRWVLARLCELRHANGRPAAAIHGPATWQDRGATITFNFLHRDGGAVAEHVVGRWASERRISLRTGGFANPGVALGARSRGAVRISLGMPANFADAHRFARFAATFADQPR